MTDRPPVGGPTSAEAEVSRTVGGLVLAALRHDGPGWNELMSTVVLPNMGPHLVCAISLLIDYGQRAAAAEGRTLEDEMREWIEDFSKDEKFWGPSDGDSS